MVFQSAGDPVEEAAAAVDAPAVQVSPGTVTLATVPPLSALIVSPVDDGDEEVIITAEGTAVDEITAQRARVTADRAGFKLREIT